MKKKLPQEIYCHSKKQKADFNSQEYVNKIKKFVWRQQLVPAKPAIPATARLVACHIHKPLGDGSRANFMDIS